jgi:hypothetical protein
MPPEIHEELQAHVDAGRVEILQDTEVTRAHPLPDALPSS